jgi:mRNA-degrading endonuclease toxin of MazEF toxin-antitoxin module
MNVRRGDVVLADLPYSDRTGSKKRPALVVQCDRNNQCLRESLGLT